jgi:hypothetical protein
MHNRWWDSYPNNHTIITMMGLRVADTKDDLFLI